MANCAARSSVRFEISCWSFGKRMATGPSLRAVFLNRSGAVLASLLSHGWDPELTA